MLASDQHDAIHLYKYLMQQSGLTLPGNIPRMPGHSPSFRGWSQNGFQKFHEIRLQKNLKYKA